MATTHKTRQTIPTTFADRVLERAPVDAAALAIITAAGFELDPYDPACVDRYEAMQRAAMLYAATVLREAGRGFPELHDSAEFALLDGEANTWAASCLVEVHGDSARWEEQVADAAKLMRDAASKAFEIAKKRSEK